MPKQALKIDRFEGGLVNHYDKRDLPEGALANATGVMVDIAGKVRPMGGEVDHAVGSLDAGLTPGYGLFSFFTDYNVNGDTSDEGYTLLAIQQDNKISIFDTAQHTNQIILGEDLNSVKPIFYYIEGALRCSDANLANTNNLKPQWYGQLKDKVWFAGMDTGNQGYEVDFNTETFSGEARTWHTTNQELKEAPRLNELMAIPAGAPANKANMPYVGLGFATDSDPTGDWVATTVHLGWTLLYEPAIGGIDEFTQESTMNNKTILDMDNATAISTGITEAHSLKLDLYVNPLDWITEDHFDPRIIGCRFYWTADANGEFEDPYHLATAYFGRSEPDPAYFESHDGDRSTFAEVDLGSSNFVLKATVNVRSMPSVTYALINEYPHNTITTSAQYTTAAVVNRRAYIGNVRRFTSFGWAATDGNNATAWTDDEPYMKNRAYDAQHDRIIKSPVNKFDIFPANNFIDIATDDGDQIVKLIGFGDKLLQFKKETLYILNVSADFEYLESKHKHMGIKRPYAVTEFEGGVAWINKNGCYLYNGEQIVDVTDNKINPGKPSSGDPIYDPEGWSAFIGETGMISYIPSLKQLVVLEEPSSGQQSGSVMIFDIQTQSWTRGQDKVSTVSKSNIVNTYDGTPLYLTQDAALNSEPVPIPVQYQVGQAPGDMIWSWLVVNGFGGGNALPGFGNALWDTHWSVTVATYVKIGDTRIAELDVFTPNSVYQLGNYLRDQIESYTSAQSRPLSCVILSDRFQVKRLGAYIDGTYSGSLKFVRQSDDTTVQNPAYDGQSNYYSQTTPATTSVIANTTDNKPNVGINWARMEQSLGSNFGNGWTDQSLININLTISSTLDNWVASGSTAHFVPLPWVYIFAMNFDAAGNNTFSGSSFSDAALENLMDEWDGDDAEEGIKGIITLKANDSTGYSTGSDLSGTTWNFGGEAIGTDSAPFKMPIYVAANLDNTNGELPSSLDGFEQYDFNDDSQQLYWKLIQANPGDSSYELMQAGHRSLEQRWWTSAYGHTPIPDGTIGVRLMSAPIMVDGFTDAQMGLLNLSDDVLADINNTVINTTSDDMELSSNNFIYLKGNIESGGGGVFTAHLFIVPGKALPETQGNFGSNTTVGYLPVGTPISLSGNSSHTDYTFTGGAGSVPIHMIVYDYIDWMLPLDFAMSITETDDYNLKRDSWGNIELYNGQNPSNNGTNAMLRCWFTRIIFKSNDMSATQRARFDGMTTACFSDTYTFTSDGVMIDETGPNTPAEGITPSLISHYTRPVSNGEFYPNVSYYVTILGQDGYEYSNMHHITTVSENSFVLADELRGLIREQRENNQVGSIVPWASEELINYTGLTITFVDATNFRVTGLPVSSDPVYPANDITRKFSLGDTIQFSAGVTFGMQLYRIASISYNAANSRTDVTISSVAAEGLMVTLPFTSGTYTGVRMTGSGVHVIGTVPNATTISNTLAMSTTQYTNLKLVRFDNTQEHAETLQTNALCIETKDYDFGMPGLDKNAYKTEITIKGTGTIKLQFAVDGNETWMDMVIGNNNFLNLSDDVWRTYQFSFGTYTNLESDIDPTLNLDLQAALINSSIKDIKSIRFRIVNDGFVSGVELNDMTLIYRIKGIT